MRPPRFQNHSYSYSPPPSGHDPMHDASLHFQKHNEHFKGIGTLEEGWMEVRRRPESGTRRAANGGYGGQQRQVVIWGRGREMKGGQGQRVTCYKCLGSGHSNYECRDPVVCRYCRRVGHYKAACPVAVIEHKGEGIRYEGMEKYLPRVACLVGEIVEGSVDEEEVIKAVVTRFLELEGLKVKKLETGEIILRQISPTVCIELCGGHQVIGDAKVQWQRIIWTDKVGENVTRPAIIDVRGIPFTYQSRKNMEAVVRSFGRLKGIIVTGLESGDPNLMVLDVEMEKEVVISQPVILQSRKGIVTVNVCERHPPAPPAKGDFGCIIEKSKGGRVEHTKAEEALAADGGMSGKLVMTGLGAEK